MKHHYVYRITNITERKHYYGVRTSTILPHLDLGIYYFSSSRDNQFQQDQINNPQNYKYKVIKTYQTRPEAINHEIKLHHKLDVAKNPNFYNRSKQTTTGFDTAGTKQTESSNKRRSESQLGKLHVSEEGKRRLSMLKSGVQRGSLPQWWRDKIRDSNIGKRTGHKHSEESKSKNSDKAKIKLNRPWKNGRIISNPDLLSMYKRLENLYVIWCKCGCDNHGYIKSYTLFSKFNIKLTKGLYNYFKQYGNPLLDEEYLKFIGAI